MRGRRRSGALRPSPCQPQLTRLHGRTYIAPACSGHAGLKQDGIGSHLHAPLFPQATAQMREKEVPRGQNDPGLDAPDPTGANTFYRVSRMASTSRVPQRDKNDCTERPSELRLATSRP